jgi:hypothetical protein
MRFRKFALATALGAAVASGPLAVAPASAETVLKAVMHSDVKIIDPIWTTAYISRNVGYMIYDTLFALDAKNDVKPQMVDKVDVSADKLTYTMTLRDGLLWHDGQPVTAEDCIQSLKRWSESAVLFARRTPGAVIVPVLVRGVVNPRAHRHPFTRLRRTPRGRERMAATLQILWPGYRAVHVRVILGCPIIAAEAPDLHAAVIAEMTRLITTPPPEGRLVLTGVV